MSASHISGLRSTLRDVFQDAANHHEMMAEVSGETIHVVLRGEFLAGVFGLDELVDRDDRFVDHEACRIVRESLILYLDEVPDGFRLKKRLLERLIREIEAVEGLS